MISTEAASQSGILALAVMISAGILLAPQVSGVDVWSRFHARISPPVYGPPAPPPCPPMPDAPGKVLTSAIMIGKPQRKLVEPKSIIKPERVKARAIVVQQRPPTASECARMSSGIAMVGREGVKLAARARGYSDAVIVRALRDCGL